MSSEEKKDINDLLLELENIHHELKAFSARVDASVLIQQLKTKLEEKRVKGQ